MDLGAIDTVFSLQPVTWALLGLIYREQKRDHQQCRCTREAVDEGRG